MPVVLIDSMYWDVFVLQTEELETSTEDTFIVSSQSPVQSELIAKHPVDKPVFVEGGFTVWLRTKSLTYFVLQADCTEKYLEYKNRPNDDSGTMFMLFIQRLYLVMYFQLLFELTVYSFIDSEM